MKVIVDRAALNDALGLLGSVIAARTPKPVLNYVKLTAADGVLSLLATDLETGLRLVISRVEVQEPGEALIIGDKFGQIVRESGDATLTIAVDASQATIRGQDSTYKLNVMPPAEYPAVQDFSGESDFEVRAGDLSQLIAQTIFATAKENSRYAINGVLLEREANKLNVVATDGRRLAVSRGTCKTAKTENRAIIVPTKALNLLSKLLTDPEQTVKVKIAESQVLFGTETATISSNLVEGNFPPYRDVVPRDGDKKATIATAPLNSAVRRAALLTNEESKSLRLSFKQGTLTLTSRTPETGEAEVTLDLPKYEGEPLDIGFNPQFIIDVLKVVDSEEVTLDLKAANKPGVFRTGQHFLYVVMPVNLT